MSKTLVVLFALLVCGLFAQDEQRLALQRAMDEQQRKYVAAYEQYKLAAMRGDYKLLVEALREPDTELKSIVLVAARNLPFEEKIHVAKAAVMDDQWDQPISIRAPEKLSQGAFIEQSRALLQETLQRDVPTPSLRNKSIRAELAAELERLAKSASPKQATQSPDASPKKSSSVNAPSQVATDESPDAARGSFASVLWWVGAAAVIALICVWIFRSKPPR